jgi:hypothetical protein
MYGIAVRRSSPGSDLCHGFRGMEHHQITKTSLLSAMEYCVIYKGK